MINCLYCQKPLKIMIDLKDNKFTCKDCKKEYNLGLNNKLMTVSCKNKKINFLLNDISSCSDKLSNNTIYDLYTKGYVKCTKVLNQIYNEHYSNWEMPLNSIKDLIVQKAENSIKELDNNIRRIQSSEESYTCSKCGNTYPFEKAVNNNFSCMICSSQLKPFNKNDEIKNINSSISFLNNNIASLSRGWC